MEFTLTFVKIFFYIIYLALPLLLAMALLVALLGQIVARLEKWTPFIGFYWAFITATTVGYGDIRAQHKRSRMLSVLIAFVGIVFTGITVAIAIEAASFAYARHEDLPKLQQKLEKLDNTVTREQERRKEIDKNTEKNPRSSP